MTIGATLLSVGILFSLHLCSHMQLASYPGSFSPTPVGENVPVVHAASNFIAHNVKIIISMHKWWKSLTQATQ